MKNQCIYSLHGVRFLSSLLVLIAHINVWGTPLQQSPYYNTLVHLPGIGMSAFFILSGFLIHYLYHGISLSSFSSVKNYYISRIARIYPLYIVMVYLCYKNIGVTYSAQSYSDLLLASFVGVQTWFYTLVDGNMFAIANFSSGWSISTELFFYFTYPFFSHRIASLDFKKAIKRLLIIISLGYCTIFLSYKVIALFPNLLGPNYGNSFFQWWVYLSPYIRMFEFLTGCLLAQIFINFPSERALLLKKHFSIAAIISVIGTILLFKFYMAGGSGLVGTFAMTFGYTPFLAIIIFYCAQYIVIPKNTLMARILLVLGECSFALYMMQELILRKFRACDDAYSLNIFDYYKLCGMYLLGMIILAIFVYKFFESPMKRLIRFGFRINRSVTILQQE